jgi:hypothetical protein
MLDFLPYVLIKTQKKLKNLLLLPIDIIMRKFTYICHIK